MWKPENKGLYWRNGPSKMFSRVFQSKNLHQFVMFYLQSIFQQDCRRHLTEAWTTRFGTLHLDGAGNSPGISTRTRIPCAPSWNTINASRKGERNSQGTPANNVLGLRFSPLKHSFLLQQWAYPVRPMGVFLTKRTTPIQFLCLQGVGWKKCWQ